MRKDSWRGIARRGGLQESLPHVAEVVRLVAEWCNLGVESYVPPYEATRSRDQVTRPANSLIEIRGVSQMKLSSERKQLQSISAPGLILCGMRICRADCADEEEPI